MKEEIKKYLLSKGDPKLLEFELKLNMKSSSSKHLGVKVPIVREYAKYLSKNYSLDYLYKIIDEEYYEELMLKGFLIGQYKNLTFKELEYYLNDFVPKIYDWGICDTVCNGLKIVKKYLDDVWLLVNKYLNSKNEFMVRFALVMILNYYLIDDYIDKVYDIINNVKLDKYYVKMANSWLISYCLIKYFDKTYSFLKNNTNIDTFTYNKGLQKARESFRISKEQKELLNKLKK